MLPVRFARVSQPFADPGGYASYSDSHGPAGHHTGVDFGVSDEGRFAKGLANLFGQRVRATRRGAVIRSAYDPTLGNFVEILSWDEDGPFVHGYWHLEYRRVEVGQRVEKGDIIGRVGSTGNSTAPHLHYQENAGYTFSYHAHRTPRHCYGPDWLRAARYRLRLRRARRRS